MSTLPNIKSEEKLLEELKNTISSLPQIKSVDFEVKTPKGVDSGIDACAWIETVKNKKFFIVIQVKAGGYPRDLEKTSEQLKNIVRKQEKEETISVVASRSISPGSRKMLQDEGIGYFDSGGSLYLPLSDNLFFIDRPVPSPERSLLNIYEGRSAQVLQIMLGNPFREWHVNELAEQSEVSPYTVHQVFTRLEKESIIERSGKGPNAVRILKKPGELLDTWAENYSYKHYKFLNFYKWSQSNHSLRDELAKILENKGIDYALTLGTGADLVAPFVTGSERSYFIVEEAGALDNVIKAAGLEQVEDGAVITFMTTKSHASLLNRQKVNDLWVASDTQLYLNLFKWKARGKEQAEHLRRERLKF